MIKSLIYWFLEQFCKLRFWTPKRVIFIGFYNFKWKSRFPILFHSQHGRKMVKIGKKLKNGVDLHIDLVLLLLIWHFRKKVPCHSIARNPKIAIFRIWTFFGANSRKSAFLVKNEVFDDFWGIFKGSLLGLILG